MAGAKPGVHVVQLRPISVPETLTKGNKFIMYNDNSTIGTPVTLKVDEKGYILYWRDQNKEMDFLDISLIKDTRTGNQVKTPKDYKLKESLMIGQMDVPLEDKLVTVVYGTDMVNLETVNFVCAHKETAQEWADELLKYSTNLLALNSSSLAYLEKFFTRFNLVLNNEGKVSMKNIVKSIANNREDRKKVDRALEAIGFHAGRTDTINPQKFTFDNFFNFYRHLVGRTEVDKIFDELGAKKKPYLTTQQFCDFLNKQQRDPRLNEILYPNYTLAQADVLIHRYENKSGMAQKGHLSQEGFLKFLMSEDNNLIPPDKLDISEDMDQPLAHYFINSSHNTYLTGHQFTGKSSVEMYHQVLLSGCRCIELDCWDGKDSDMEPVITHGYTMCTEVLFKDVIEAIAQSAFKTSEFPVILSFENHCSPKQQAKMANYCRTIFGEMLLINPLDTNPLKPDVPLPSPNALKYKIIIKNKKKHFHREKTSRKNRAQNMSKRMRQKQAAAAAASEGIVKTRLSEVEEDVELSIPPTTSAPAPEPPASPVDTKPPVLDPPTTPTPETEPKSPSRIALEKNLSICSEGTESTEVSSVTKEDDDAFDSDSDSSDSDDDEEVITEEEKEKVRKKQKKILTEEEKKRRQRMKKEKGTAGKEASAAMEMSLLVNYIQPVHFHSFEASEKRRRSYEITSFVETQGTALLKEFPPEFVNYNKRQMSRIYPRGTRVDSSNFMPQVFWNAGCQLVALNYQTLDLAMQINMGIFEYNGRTGYIVKPDFMRRADKHFDPFAESTVDGIIAGTVSVKIISGQLLSDKKVGTYVEVDMYGLPTDTVRKKFRTKTVPSNGINPVYNEEPFVFKKVVLPNLATVRIAVYEDQGKSLIGHRVLPVEGLRPGYRHIPLRNECNQPLLTPTLFVHIVVKDYVPDSLAEYADALFNPIAYQSNLEKHAQQLEILTEDFEEEVTEKEAEVIEAIVSNTPYRENSKKKVSSTKNSMKKVLHTKNSTKKVPDTKYSMKRVYQTSMKKVFHSSTKKLPDIKHSMEKVPSIKHSLEKGPSVKHSMEKTPDINWSKEKVPATKNSMEEVLHSSLKKAEERDPSTLKTSVSQMQIDLNATGNNGQSSGVPAPDSVSTANKRQNSVTSRSTSVSMSPLPHSDSIGIIQTKPSYNRMGSMTHIPVSKQESSQSANSQGSSGSLPKPQSPPLPATTPMTRMQSGMLGTENGSAAASIIQSTRLSDTSILNPTPLSDLKTVKSFLKAIAKRDKELENIRRKYEKAREMMEEQHQLLLGKLISSQTKSRISMEKHHSKVLKKMAKEGKDTEQKQNQLKGELQELLTIQDLKHREMKAAHCRRVMKLCKEHYQAELDLQSRHHEQIYSVLHQLMESNHASHAKALDEIHDREVTELKKRMDAQSRDHMKLLGKKHRDKQELSRIKREAQQKHVQTAVTERQKLKDILDKRQGELEAKLGEIKKEFQKEKEEGLRAFKEEFEENLQKIEEELGSQLGDDDYNDDETLNRDDAFNGSNGSQLVSNGEVERGPHMSTITVKGPSKDSPNKENGSTIHDSDSSEQLNEKVNSEEQLTSM